MMKSTRTTLIALAMTLSAVTLLCDTTTAREVRCKILQQKLGRLYFSAGKEEDIFPGCRWVIYRDSTDTLKPLIEGKIAESYDGVSVSDSLKPAGIDSVPAAFPVITAADSVPGTVGIAAAIDAINSSVVGDSVAGLIVSDHDRWSAGEIGSDFQRQNGVRFTHRSARTYAEALARLVEVLPTSFVVTDWRSFAPYPSDVHIRYNQQECERGEFHMFSPTPFFVALIPNVSRPINRNALLTTALRYKIDTARLSNAFEFGAVTQQSFLPNNVQYSAYAFDADKGKKLLKESKSGGTSVTIDCYSPTLISTCRFIRGTLAQAGYSTTSVGWNEPADLRFMIVPLRSDSPMVALREVINSLAADTVSRDKSNQPIRLAARLMEDARQTTDSVQRAHLLQRVDRILMEDIGAFPLFRPIIHICAKEEIRGLRFDEDGRIDLRNVYRVKLPTDSTSTSP